MALTLGVVHRTPYKTINVGSNEIKLLAFKFSLRRTTPFSWRIGLGANPVQKRFRVQNVQKSQPEIFSIRADVESLTSEISKPDEKDEEKALNQIEEIQGSVQSSLSGREERLRSARVQVELELFQENEWKRRILKAQGKLRGTQWDPLPGKPMHFSTFWNYAQKGQIKYMEYAEGGRLVAAILPHPANEAGYKVKVMGAANPEDAQKAESVVYQRHPVLQMPADSQTELWATLAPTVRHVAFDRPYSIPCVVGPSFHLAALWMLRLALALAVVRYVDRKFLFPKYKATPAEAYPKYRQLDLSEVIASGLGSLGQSRARFISAEERTGASFADFAGQPYVKAELYEVMRMLRGDPAYLDMGVYCPRGVMLHGPPGTGKTLLARAIAGEAGLPFFAVSGSEFVEMFAGVAAARVRDLFMRARQFSPSIIFIDEIDAIGAARGSAGKGGGSLEREQGLIQILTEMDGFEKDTTPILVIGATNRVDMLDPALLRKGRFDKILRVGRPSLDGRLEILQVHARTKSFENDDVKLELLREVAKICDTATGAELMNILNEASILAARYDEDHISRRMLLEAIDRQAGKFGTGVEDVFVPSEESKLRVAYREAAVAVLDCFYPQPLRPPTGTITYVLDRKPNMQYQKPPHRVFSRKTDLVEAMVRACAPGVVEDMVFGGEYSSFSTGTSLAVAAQMADFLVLKSGLTALGQAVYDTEQDLVPHIRPKLVALRDEYLRYAVQKCESILVEYQAAVEELAEILMDSKEVKAEVFKSVFDSCQRMPAPAVREPDEYYALMSAGRWGIHGLSLPGRVTFSPGPSGYATYGAPRPNLVTDAGSKVTQHLKLLVDLEKKAGEDALRAKESRHGNVLLPLEQVV